MFAATRSIPSTAIERPDSETARNVPSMFTVSGSRLLVVPARIFVIVMTTGRTC